MGGTEGKRKGKKGGVREWEDTMYSLFLPSLTPSLTHITWGGGREKRERKRVQEGEKIQCTLSPFPPSLPPSLPPSTLSLSYNRLILTK